MLTKKQNNNLVWVAWGCAIVGGTLLGLGLKNEKRKNVILAQTCKGTIDHIGHLEDRLNTINEQLEQTEADLEVYFGENEHLKELLANPDAASNVIFPKLSVKLNKGNYIRVSKIKESLDELAEAKRLRAGRLTYAAIAKQMNKSESYIRRLLAPNHGRCCR